MGKFVPIRGKTYRIDLDVRKLINVDNPRDTLPIDTDEVEYFRQLLKGEGGFFF